MTDRREVLGLGVPLIAGLIGARWLAEAREQPAPKSDQNAAAWQETLRNYRYGVALAGLEFGENVLPGRFRAEIQAPPADRYPHYAELGIRSVRLPMLWERFQPELFGPIDGAVDLLSTDRQMGVVLFRDMVLQQLDLAHRHGIKVLIDPHNYGARAIRQGDRWIFKGGTGRLGRFAIGSPEVPTAAFADFCARLARAFGDHPALLGFDLMNEPVAMPGAGRGWSAAAQLAITAVRKTGCTAWLFVEGYHYANPFAWRERNPDLHLLRDPMDRLVFSAHLYFDEDHSGRYLADEALGPRPVSTLERAVRDIEPFFAWLDQHGLRGHLGEFGVPNTRTWQPIVTGFIDACTRRDVMLHAWADWPSEGNYVLALNGRGAPKPLVQYLSQRARNLPGGPAADRNF